MITPLIKNTRLACTLLAIVLAIPAFAAGPVSLLQLQQTGGSLIDGDKKFSSFGFSGPTNRVNPADVFVETVSLPGGLLGLKFSGALTATGPSLDVGLFYSVETTNGLPLISEIGQSFTMSASGNGGFALIGETVFDQGFFLGNTVAQSSIGFADIMDPAGEPIQGDQLIINPPKNKVWVTKDVNLIPNDAESTVGLSNIIQVFCQNQVVLACPTNRTVACNTAWNFDVPSATNACCPGPITITVTGTVTNQISSCTFCATRTWVLTDSCGNNTTCAQTICFIRDTTPPVITCPTNLNLGCNPLTIPECSLTQVQASDDCGPVVLTCSFTDTTNGCNRLRTVIYVATDQCTNRAACTQTIAWIQDTNPPVFTLCPPDRDLGCNPEAIPGCNLGQVAVQDDCGPVGVTCSSVDTTNGCTRVRTITYTAIDICTNRAFCVQRLTWKVDTTPPVLTGVPTNRNFQCFADYLALPPAVVTATDDCDGTNVVVSAISGISGTCPTIIEACWIAIDQCSNSTRVCVTYTIRDTIPPIIRCPPNLSVGCDTNVPPCPMTLAGFIAIGGFASDNCDTNLDFFCFDGPRIGNQIVRTFTVCDDCTNCASCTQIITFVGNTPPSIVCPPDLTVECSNNIPAAAATLAQFLAAGGWTSTTNVLSFGSVTGPFVGSHCDGSITRTYTITDLCSNTVSCQQHIFVRDTTPPNIHCGADKEVQCGTDWAFDIPTATDNCDGINVPIVLVSTVTNIAEPRCPRIYSVTRTWRATDSCSNSAFCNQTVTIVDTEPPNITCEQDKEELCGIAWAFDIPTAVDKCDLNNVLIQVVSTVTNISTPRCPAIFSVTRTWKASDTCGNASFCNQTVTIVDIEPPNITCEQDKEVNCGTAWFFDIPTAVDKCDLNNVLIEVVATVTNISQPRCPALFSVTRTWRATDTCGNAAFCNQTVTVVDLEPPNITCGPNKDVQCGTDWAFDIPTAVDKCDLNNVLIEVVATVTNVSVPRCPSLFSVTRTWRATDTCGNNSFCNQTVTVVDTQPPHLTCGPDKQVQCGSDWAFDIPTATDGCDAANVLIEVVATVTNVSSARCPKLFSVSRIWRATDTCGNRSFCGQIVTIVDTQPPNITCGSDKEAECGTDWFFDIPTAVDVCDLNNVLIEVVATVTNIAQAQCPKVYSVTRTWRATDTCGNAAFCNQTVTTVDTEPPNLACGSDKEVECGSDWAFDIPTAVDKCNQNVTVQIVSTVTNTALPFCPKIASITRTWRATDSCGNFSFCNQTVTVLDTEPPNLVCGPDKDVACGTDWAFDIPTAADQCGGFVLRLDPSQEPGGSGGTGSGSGALILSGNNLTINLTYSGLSANSTAAHIHGPAGRGTNAAVLYPLTLIPLGTTSGTVSQIIPLVDGTGGFSIAQQLDQLKNGLWYVNIHTTAHPGGEIRGQLDSSALVELVSTVTNAPSQRCPKILSATRTWRATDACGNISFCNQTVTVVDTAPPQLTCAHDQIVECGLSFAFTPPTAVDACDGTNVVITLVGTTTNAASPRCPGIFTVRRTWRAVDTCNNEALCSQTITIVDTTPPNLTCADDQQVECGTPFAFTPPTAVDACDGANVTIEVVNTTTNAAVPQCPGLFTVRRTWRAYDSCTNVSFCSQTITLLDTTPPNITCADDRVVECVLPSGFTPPFAIDACSGTNVVITIVNATTNLASPRCPNLYTVHVTWRAVDTCGNASLCSQTLRVVDTTPPTLICAPDRFVECGLPWAFTPPSAMDGCDGTNITIVIVSTETNSTTAACLDLSATRTWRATDTCGNSAVCRQTIHVIDTTPPEMVCANDRVVQCGVPFNFTPPFAIDICSGTNVTIAIVSTVTNAQCGRSFTATRTWSAADACGNTVRCSQSIAVVDTVPPEITCAQSRVLECGTPWNFTPPAANDVCDGTNVVVAIVSTVTNALCGNTYNATRTWSATDLCGNRSLCSQSITLVDTMPPVVTCAPDRLLECGTPWNFSAPSVTDVCDGTNVVIQIVSTVTNQLCGRTLSATRTWRATDRCGNNAGCSQTITLVDTTPPNLTCAPNQTFECGTPWAFTPPVANDICDGTNVAVVIVSTVTNATCGNAFNATRTWKATDACGNMSTCSQTINVVDTTPPTLSCSPDRTVECGTPFTFTPPFAQDSCDGTNVTVTIVSTATNTLCGSTFVAVRTWQAVDRCGNRSQCSQTIRVLDTQAPELSGVPGNQTFICLGDVPPPPPVTAFDLCDTNVTVFFTSVTNGRCPYLITRCWTAVDDCSNSVQACQMITVSPTPPTLVGPTNMTICPGNPAIFCGVVSSACPVTLQWYRDGVAIPGATNVCYTIPSVTLPDAGLYCLAANGPCHSVTNCARLEVCMAALGDFVWNDFDQDGIQDAGEPGVENVEVQLYDCLDHPMATKFTDEFGGYLFTGLTAGTYRVTFVLPAGYKFTTPNVGNDALDSDADTVTGRTGCYTLAANETNRTVDAGIIQPAALGDFVWNDFDQDGLQGPGEIGVPNVTVRLSDCLGALLATTNTDANGGYLFTDLKPGNYKVTFVAPPGFEFTITDAGNDALDSDANQNTGMTGCYTLGPGETNRTVDAGLIQSMVMGAGGCRVTGGSNHQTNSYQSACITTPLPSHISHGGQVGAPFSVGTPFMPNSPCISGEWQHNRHLSGNSLVGNFHASGNGHEHQFDSLLCACLPCPENPNSPGLVGEICNPGDRICGPEPSKAPANKICFSGVGDYTFTNGKKTVKAVFRVDVEDRGEGNSQSSSSPPDRYRIRIWILDPSCGRNPDPNSAEAMAIRYAASADPTKINTLATTEDLKVNIPPDIDDGGNLTQGNQQIHKATGAKCKDVTPMTQAVDIDVSTLVTPVMQTVAARSYNTVAQGFLGTRLPSFVYKVTITNSGTTSLRGITVTETTDGVAKDTTALFNLGSQARLGAGESATRYFTNSVPADSVTMVTVTGKVSNNSTPVFATSTAVAWVSTQLPLSIRRSGNTYVMEWPSSVPPGTVIEATTSLKAPVVWSVISSNAVNPFVVTNPPQSGARFYRLRMP